jgi:N-acylneuraminate cytidylyltransferase/CMP-N,N'-diacetyllegionaminic acid synthase
MIQTLLIVPARSGSKGLPDKNIRLLAGKPLLTWTAEAIIQAGLPHSLAILSTDNPDYAQIGRQSGLTVPFLRPASCAGDSASALQVIEQALAWFQGEYAYVPEQIMWLQPTSPFRSVAVIQQADAMLVEQQVDSVIGCMEIHRDLTTLFACEQGFLRPLNKLKPTQTARQQVEPLLTPNGAMYLCKTAYLLENQSFYPEKTVPLIMNALQSLDIDDEMDWLMAEAFIKQGLV